MLLRKILLVQLLEYKILQELADRNGKFDDLPTDFLSVLV